MNVLRRITPFLCALFFVSVSIVSINVSGKIELNVLATTAQMVTNDRNSTKQSDLKSLVQKISHTIAAEVSENCARASKEPAKKRWTIILYMAADNDLYPFASQNLSQMKEIGSNKYLNILVHLDIKVPGKEKVTKRLYIEKNKIIQIGEDAKLNSGSDETFANAVLWAINDYPSEHLAVLFWNHGSGDLNPVLKKTINPAYLFKYNPDTNMIDLDRSIDFIDFIDMLGENDNDNTVISSHKQDRGICFDETFRSYLDDEKLMRALTKIVAARNGKKIDLVIFDACLMAGTGTTWIMSQFANYMVASEEVVLGPGYNYRTALTLFTNGTSDSREIAKSLVACYEQTYSKITNDYTHSATDLSQFSKISENIDLVARLLIKALATQRDNSVKNVIKACRSRYMCTCFDEKSYIDLFNLYANLLSKLNDLNFTSKKDGEVLRQTLSNALKDGLALAKTFIIANVCGSNLSRAQGISIYFPEFKTNSPHHASYQNTEFAKNNSWLNFLQTYLAL